MQFALKPWLCFKKCVNTSPSRVLNLKENSSVELNFLSCLAQELVVQEEPFFSSFLSDVMDSFQEKLSFQRRISSPSLLSYSNSFLSIPLCVSSSSFLVLLGHT